MVVVSEVGLSLSFSPLNSLSFGGNKRKQANDQPHLPLYKPKRHWINVPRTRRRKGAKKFQVRKNRIVPRGNQFDFRNDMHV
jgi:hypothetical protein